MTTNEQSQLRDFDIESKDDKHPNMGGEKHSQDTDVNDDDLDEV